MSDDDGLRRLAETIRRRRLDLGLTQQEAADQGGLSATTWRMAEKYQQAVSDLSQVAIAKALGWRSDGVARVLAGEEPELADSSPPNPIERIRENQRTGGLPASRSGVAIPDDLDEVEQAILDAALNEIRRRRAAG